MKKAIEKGKDPFEKKKKPTRKKPTKQPQSDGAGDLNPNHFLRGLTLYAETEEKLAEEETKKQQSSLYTLPYEPKVNKLEAARQLQDALAANAKAAKDHHTNPYSKEQIMTLKVRHYEAPTHTTSSINNTDDFNNMQFNDTNRMSTTTTDHMLDLGSESSLRYWDACQRRDDQKLAADKDDILNLALTMRASLPSLSEDTSAFSFSNPFFVDEDELRLRIKQFDCLVACKRYIYEALKLPPPDDYSDNSMITPEALYGKDRLELYDAIEDNVESNN